MSICPSTNGSGFESNNILTRCLCVSVPRDNHVCLAREVYLRALRAEQSKTQQVATFYSKQSGSGWFRRRYRSVFQKLRHVRADILHLDLRLLSFGQVFHLPPLQNSYKQFFLGGAGVPHNNSRHTVTGAENHRIREMRKRIMSTCDSVCVHGRILSQETPTPFQTSEPSSVADSCACLTCTVPFSTSLSPMRIVHLW